MGELRKILFCGLAGLTLEIAGVLCLAGGFLRTAQVLAIYPSSLVFHVLPQAIIDRLSEAALFWVGVASGILSWGLTLYLLCQLPKLAAPRTPPRSAHPC